MSKTQTKKSLITFLERIDFEINSRDIMTKNTETIDNLSLINEFFAINENVRNIHQDLLKEIDPKLHYGVYLECRELVMEILQITNNFNTKWNITYRMWLDNIRTEKRTEFRSKSESNRNMHTYMQSFFPMVNRIQSDIADVFVDLNSLSIAIRKLVKQVREVKSGRFSFMFYKKMKTIFKIDNEWVHN
ncbi:hypothetical protein [Proteus mirabilis]|uniref:hypothetical protein n=1 Tax=Proteus mirabilis TaxID=584 RepID=UPI0034D3F8EE